MIHLCIFLEPKDFLDALSFIGMSCGLSFLRQTLIIVGYEQDTLSMMMIVMDVHGSGSKLGLNQIRTMTC